MNIRLALSGALVAGLILAAGGEVSAQATTSTLIGDVRDIAGEPVSDAIVQARSEKTGAVRTGLTDAKGVYRIDGLTPGGWTVVARLGGGLSDSCFRYG